MAISCMHKLRHDKCVAISGNYLSSDSCTSDPKTRTEIAFCEPQLLRRTEHVAHRA